MKRKLLYCGIIAAAMLVHGTSFAKQLTVDGLVYDLNDDGTAVLFSKTTEIIGDIIIPDVVTDNGKTYTVIVISGIPFKGNTNITSVQLPSGLKKLVGRTFEGCTNLEKVTGGPESLEQIDAYTFDDTKWLNNQPDGFVVFKKWVLAHHGPYNGETFAIPNGVIGVAPNSFQVNGGSITAKKLYIPASVKSYSYVDVKNLSTLERIEVDVANATYFSDAAGAFYAYDYEYLSGGSYVTGQALLGMPRKINVDIYNVHPGTKYLESFSGSVTGIGQFNVPEGVEVLSANVFRDASPKNIDLPSTIVDLDFGLYKTGNTEKVVIRATTMPKYDRLLFNQSRNTTLYVPDAMVEAYKAVSSFTESLKDILPLSQYESVEDVTVSSDATVTAIYGVDGAERSSLQPGLNIVRCSDGTARKVLHRN